MPPAMSVALAPEILGGSGHAHQWHLNIEKNQQSYRASWLPWNRPILHFKRLSVSWAMAGKTCNSCATSKFCHSIPECKLGVHRPLETQAGCGLRGLSWHFSSHPASSPIYVLLRKPFVGSLDNAHEVQAPALQYFRSLHQGEGTVSMNSAIGPKIVFCETKGDYCTFTILTVEFHLACRCFPSSLRSIPLLLSHSDFISAPTPSVLQGIPSTLWALSLPFHTLIHSSTVMCWPGPGW